MLLLYIRSIVYQFNLSARIRLDTISKFYIFILSLQDHTLEELEAMDLDGLVEMLTPADIEYFFQKHGISNQYYTQIKLCDEESAKDCWWCMRFISRQCKDLDFLPCNTIPSNTHSEWILFPERVAALRSEDPEERRLARERFLTDKYLPSVVLRNSFETKEAEAFQSTPDVINDLALKTNLNPVDVAACFEKFQAEKQRKNVRSHRNAIAREERATAAAAAEEVAAAAAPPPPLTANRPVMRAAFNMPLFWQQAQSLWLARSQVQAAIQQRLKAAAGAGAQDAAGAEALHSVDPEIQGGAINVMENENRVAAATTKRGPRHSRLYAEREAAGTQSQPQPQPAQVEDSRGEGAIASQDAGAHPLTIDRVANEEDAGGSMNKRRRMPTRRFGEDFIFTK